MSSVFIETPFLENSLVILVNSLSSFDLSITGTPSTTRVLSKLSSYWTWYLRENWLKVQEGYKNINSLSLNVRVVNRIVSDGSHSHFEKYFRPSFFFRVVDAKLFVVVTQSS